MAISILHVLGDEQRRIIVLLNIFISSPIINPDKFSVGISRLCNIISTSLLKSAAVMILPLALT
jgi:hypothetical protein